MIRKNIFTFFIFLLLTLLFPVSVGAQGTNEEAVPISTEEVDVSEYEKAKVTNSGSIYITGENEVIENNINNDVVFGGGELVINGNVLDNVIFAGAAVEINGNVDGDILFA